MRRIDLLYAEMGILKESRFSGGTAKGICTDCAYKGDVSKPCPACGTNTVVAPKKDTTGKESPNPKGQ